MRVTKNATGKKWTKTKSQNAPATDVVVHLTLNRIVLPTAKYAGRFNKKGHYASMCLSKSTINVRAIEDDGDDETCFLGKYAS